MQHYPNPPQPGGGPNQGPPQPGYTSAVQQTYPYAVFADTLGSYLQLYLQQYFGVNASQAVLSNSVCSDDVDALALPGNIGQWPKSLSTFLGPFFSGGLAGYPHTGVTGLLAWESHYYYGSSLLIFNAPHIGITRYNDIGYMYRRGQGNTKSNTCGAIATANNWVIANGAPPTTGDFPNDYQQYTITNMLYPYKSTLAAGSYADNMVFSTYITAVSSSQWFIQNTPTTGYYNAAPPTDIYYCGATFINTDDGYLGYVDVNTFQKLPSGSSSWVDYSTSFRTGLTAYSPIKPPYIPCLVKGTKVLLSSGVYKLIEDINYQDELVVWNFDDGKFDFTNPLWIKQPQTHIGHNLIKFSDGSELKTLQAELGHRIFNVEKGMFTYPMTDDTPIGTHTFNEKGELVSLISKEIVNEEVEYYNIITSKHMNLFTNSILTSCRYNNIYPIVDMKFVKDERPLRTREEFSNISDKYFEGFRLAEQTFALNEIEAYMEEREALDVKAIALV